MLRLVGIIALVLAGTLPAAAATRFEDACRTAAMVDQVPPDATVETRDAFGTITLTATTASGTITVTCEFDDPVAVIPKLSRMAVTPGGDADAFALDRYNQAIWDHVMLGK